MLNPRWYKVLSDIQGNMTRTVLVVLSIAVGVFAVGMIATSREILSKDMSASYAAIDPAHATIIVRDAFDQDLVEVVRHMREVGEAEGRRSVSVRFQAGPDEWRDLQLFAIDDYDDIRINKIWSESGAWPPPEREVLIERGGFQGGLGLDDKKVGHTLLIEPPNLKTRQLRIAGVTHDISRSPPFFSGVAYGYITFDTLEWLGEPRDFNELHIVVAENAFDREHVERVVKKVEDKVEKSGQVVVFTEINKPGESPVHDPTQAMLLLMGVLGFLSLLLSGFLVINTISALLAQHVKHIGIMKSIGASAGQIMGMYFVMVLIFGVCALIIGVPLGALGARANINFIAGLMNYDIVNFYVPPLVIVIQVAVGLLVPFLAALYPVIAGTRVTVREALTDYGLGGGEFGESFIDRLLKQVRSLSRPLLLALRNTFRNRGRLALTLVTLILGGATFIAVFCVRDSLLLTLDEALAYFQYDIEIDFSRPYRIEQIEREALSVPGAVSAESWLFVPSLRIRDDDSESDRLLTIGLPAGTEMLRPTLLEGRWLLPEDENAVVINSEVVKEEPDVKVGDEIVLKTEGLERTWHVVGRVKSVLVGPFLYANYPYLAHVLCEVGKASRMHVVTEQHDGDFQSEMVKRLEERFNRLGLRISSTGTNYDLRNQIESQFDIIVVFLLIMAILLAVVGGLGLMGTMSINVLERTREIGVMRAIGASDRAVLQNVMVEGILIGVISWCIGTLAALPISKLLSDAVGLSFMQEPLVYTFSVSGTLLWLVVVAGIASLASYLPARSASQLTVREVLSYG